MDTSTGLSAGLNAGLTQALSDGANAYIYGNGRIAQVNTTTEYFLGDALGSVRQLTNPSGSITYAKVYDPYGVVTAAAGTSQSAYGYTSEYTSQGLVYLRSRYYASGTGRFLTRDTWGGDANSPMSFNKWNYTLSNPTNYTDPSGECSSLPADNIKYIEKNAGSFLSKSNWLDTYTAAGIAVQCWAVSVPNNDPYDGYGPAQITNKEISTPWGDIIDDGKGGDPRGYGLLCYIVKKSIPRYRT